jgi:hypothetical protein
MPPEFSQLRQVTNMNDITKLRKDLETLKTRFGKCPDMLCSTCGGYGYHIFSVLGPQDIVIIKSTLESATLTEYDLLGEWRELIERKFPIQVRDINVRTQDIGIRKSNLINQNDLASFLESATLAELGLLDEWENSVQGKFPDQVLDIFIRESETMDQHNPESLGKFIFMARDLITWPGVVKPRSGLFSAITKVASEKWKDIYESVLDQAFAIANKTRDVSLIETLVITHKGQILEDRPFLDMAIAVSKTHPELQRVLYNFLREEVEDVRDFTGSGGSIRPY